MWALPAGTLRALTAPASTVVRNREITLREINQVIDAARAVALPMDREVIHVLPQEFIVDGQGGILDPTGMTAMRLEAKVHIVHCCSDVGPQHCEMRQQRWPGSGKTSCSNNWPSAAAVLTPEESEHGRHRHRHWRRHHGTSPCWWARASSTRRCWRWAAITSPTTWRFGLGATIAEAERVKKAHGCTYQPMLDPYASVEVKCAEGRPAQKFTSRDLCDVIEPRVEEMLEMAHREVSLSGYAERMPAGVVLTGGTALLRGIVELAEEVFGGAVRCGAPRDIGGLVGMV